MNLIKRGKRKQKILTERNNVFSQIFFTLVILLFQIPRYCKIYLNFSYYRTKMIKMSLRLI